VKLRDPQVRERVAAWYARCLLRIMREGLNKEEQGRGDSVA